MEFRIVPLQIHDHMYVKFPHIRNTRLIMFKLVDVGFMISLGAVYFGDRLGASRK